MQLKTLNDIAKHLLLTDQLSFKQNPIIKGIETDSRKVKPNDLFICISGYTVDGHDYVHQAIAQNAVAIIAEKQIDQVDIPVIYVENTNEALGFLANYFYDFPSNQLHLIGVTGTNGKTSVTYLLDDIFKYNLKKTALIGTIEMKIVDQIYPIDNTTPESSFLQKGFSEMVYKNVDHCMMEVSSHALELGRVNGCDFDIAVFTNLSQDHLDFHGTMDDYLRAKMRLFERLGNKYQIDKPKYAVLNRDDPHFFSLKKATSQRVVTYGIEHPADFMAKDIQLSTHGTVFTLVVFNSEFKITTPLIGKFNIYNILAAAVTAYLSGVSIHIIKGALAETSSIRGRFETVKGKQGFTVIIDFAHTPDSLENVLKTIRAFARNKVYLVMGCGGDRDRSKRPLMAAVGEKYADFLILTSDNPRTEDPSVIISDMKKGLESDRYVVKMDRLKAIHHAIDLAEKNDCILIAGKGHETTQTIGYKAIPFDDYKVAYEAIEERF